MRVSSHILELLSTPINLFLKFPKKAILNICHAYSSDSNVCIHRVREKNLTYLDKNALRELSEVVTANEKHGIKGSIIEAGCALGGSAIVIASSKAIERPFYIYDAFGMIPSPSAKDDEDVHKRYEIIKDGKSKGIGSDVYYGYVKNLYEKVKNNFEDFELDLNTNNITLVKGFFQETMTIDFPVSLAHIDCDWYESVMTCLERIWPQLVPAGSLVIDDYYRWSGCKQAVNKYFSSKHNNAYQFRRKARLHIIKK